MFLPLPRKVLMILGVIVVLMLSCSLPVSFSLFPTPTSTPTSTSTNTATSTSTYTATPLPPLQIIPCLLQENCAYAKSVVSLLPSGNVLKNTEYPIAVWANEAVYVFTAWCAIDRDVLEGILKISNLSSQLTVIRTLTR